MITPAYGMTATERVLPRLALDFTTGALDPRVTVARALNTATRVNSSGLIEIINANLPRFDYDPVTLAPKGLLIEESRTNLMLQSQAIDQSPWAVSQLNTTGTPAYIDVAASPDGTQNADKLIPNTVSTQHYAQQAITLANNTVYALTVYAKASELIAIRLSLGTKAGAFPGAYFNLSTGVVTNEVSSPVSTSITPVGNGWYRCTVVANSGTGGTAPQLRIWAISGVNTISFAGNDSDGVLVWGAQLEAGAFATSYIPTTTTSLTRNADVVSMTGTNFSDWYNQTEGSFVFQYSRYQNTDAFGIVLETKPSSTSTANRFGAAATSTADPRFQLVPNGTSILDTGGTFGVLPVNTVVKGAFAYRSGDSAATRNGASPSNSATAFATPTYTNLQIGGTDNGLYGPPTTSQLNGHIRSIRYYPQRIINAEVQSFSK
jgi:hypothetical protein